MIKLRLRGIIIIGFVVVILLNLIFWLVFIIFSSNKVQNDILNVTNDNLSHIVPNQVAVVSNIWIYNNSRLDILKENKVKYIFIDVGGTNENGTFKNSFEEIERFLDFINVYQLENEYEFILLPYSEVKSININITTPGFKKNFVEAYVRLVEMGYDGLLVDIEPVIPNERDSFMEILYDLRTNLDEKAVISVYTGHIIKEENDNVWEWEESFYREVTMAVDIISAPAYDTNFKNKQDYQNHLKEQIRLLSQFDETQILIAIPTHRKYPELSAIALDTIYKEVFKYPNSNIIGVTIFAEWTSKKEDWNNLNIYLKKLEEKK